MQLKKIMSRIFENTLPLKSLAVQPPMNAFAGARMVIPTAQVSQLRIWESEDSMTIPP